MKLYPDDWQVKLTAGLVSAACLVAAMMLVGMNRFWPFLLSIVVAFVMTVYQFPRLSRLRDADVLVQLLTNLVVACYAFPAFKRTKKREFLALGFAALLLAYGALFPVLALAAISPGSRSQIRWYYAAIHTPTIVGFVLYAYGAVSLARSARRSDGISV